MLYTGFFYSAWFSALAKTYSFAILASCMAVANCKCVWLLALAYLTISKIRTYLSKFPILTVSPTDFPFKATPNGDLMFIF